MKKTSLVTTLFTLLLLIGLQTSAEAQIKLGAHGGIHFDGTEIIIGPSAQFELPFEIAGTPVIGNPSIDFYPFVGSEADGIDGVDVSFLGVNFDLLYPVNLDISANPYVGAGLGFFRSSVDLGGFGDFSDTSLLINLKGGATFGEPGSLQPFGELVLSIGDGSGILVRGGVLFSLGG